MTATITLGLAIALLTLGIQAADGLWCAAVAPCPRRVQSCHGPRFRPRLFVRLLTRISRRNRGVPSEMLLTKRERRHMPAQITLAQLNKAGACEAQTALFQKLFGKSVALTEALAVKHAQDFAFGWAARHLLSPSARAAYDAAVAPCPRRRRHPVTRAGWALYGAVRLAGAAAAGAAIWGVIVQ